jgi:putative NIF3 family GTP cyclohydrolase 1 type 2
MSLISSDFSCEDDFILSAKIDMEFEQFVEHIKKVLNINYDMNVIQCHNKLTSFSLVTGSGMGFLDNIKTDLFLTGDIKYHEAIEAKLRGISLVDITHYESEKFFCECLYNELNEFQKFAIISNLKNPFKRL